MHPKPSLLLGTCVGFVKIVRVHVFGLLRRRAFLGGPKKPIPGNPGDPLGLLDVPQTQALPSQSQSRLFATYRTGKTASDAL